MNDYPIALLYLCAKIRKLSKLKIIPYHVVKEALERNLINWSKEIKYKILKDMEKYKVLKKINNHSYEICNEAEKESMKLLRTTFSF